MLAGSRAPRPVRFKVEFENCPVEASLGVLGRKWALLVLRDIALFRARRFNEMMLATRGMTKRVLSMRLSELEREGFIVRTQLGHKHTVWDVTNKGRDVLPVLMTLVEFGAKWHADRVFLDQRSRSLSEVFDEKYIERVLGRVPAAGGSRETPRAGRRASEMARKSSPVALA